MVEDRLDQFEIPCVQVLKISPGDLSRGDIFGTVRIDDLTGQMEETTVLMFMPPETPGGKEEIQMGKFTEEERLLVHDEPCLEERDIKSFPVIGNH
jgi:hypothetical protein